jgi:pimeloyl-ACP methyl ester carboxylesterase
MRSLTAPTRRALLGALCSVTLPPLAPANAWCGERIPSWAYYLKWDEVSVPFSFGGEQGNVRYRVVGDQTREVATGVPPVLVVGTPGLGYDYLENIEALTVSDRRVIEVTFAGTAEKALPSALLTADACAAQLQAVCAALKVSEVHVIAHGLGALPALRLVTPASGGSAQVGVRSLVLVSPFGGEADLRRAPTGPGDAASLGAVLLPTASGNARGTCIAEARTAASAGGSLLPALLSGGSAGGAKELLGREGALGKRLAVVNVPVLLANGADDKELVDMGGWTDIPPSVSRSTFGLSGPLPFIEQRDDFLLALLQFFDKADGKVTNREFKFSNDLAATVKEYTS